MEGYGHPKAGIYDGGDNISYHLRQPNAPVVPLTLQGGYYGGSGHLRWYYDLPELQLCHTYQGVPTGSGKVPLMCVLS